jgi:serine/threonine-protein kinase RsbW
VERRQTFPARLDQGPTLAAFVETALAGMDARLSMRLRLVVEELFVNTVTHGHGGDSDAPVDISIRLAGDRVVLTYVDVGPPFDPFAEMPAPAVDAGLDDLVTRFASRYEYARAGEANRVTVELPAGP